MQLLPHIPKFFSEACLSFQTNSSPAKVLAALTILTDDVNKDPR